LEIEDITEQDLKIAFESAKSNNPQAFLILAKMYCAKKGMASSEWEDIFGEQKLRERLRQMGISEGFVAEIVASSVQAGFDHLCSASHFLSVDKSGELKCSICPKKPYRAMTIAREEKGSDSRDAVVVVLCKQHLKRAGVRHDVKLVHFIAEQSKLHEQPEN
jgi:hypothetical protein